MAISFSKKQSPREIALQGDHRELLLIPLYLIGIGAVIFIDHLISVPGTLNGTGELFKMLLFGILGVALWIVRTLKNRNQALLSIIDDLEARLAKLENHQPSPH